MESVEAVLNNTQVDIIGISAGFDYHVDDWGGLLETEDYFTMGRWVKENSKKNHSGCFAILEGGYNHNVIGKNANALLKGMLSV